VEAKTSFQCRGDTLKGSQQGETHVQRGRKTLEVSSKKAENRTPRGSSSSGKGTDNGAFKKSQESKGKKNTLLLIVGAPSSRHGVTIPKGRNDKSPPFTGERKKLTVRTELKPRLAVPKKKKGYPRLGKETSLGHVVHQIDTERFSGENRVQSYRKKGLKRLHTSGGKNDGRFIRVKKKRGRPHFAKTNSWGSEPARRGDR